MKELEEFGIVGSLKDELAQLNTQTRMVLKRYRSGDVLQGEALRASIPRITDLITRCYKQKLFQYSLLLIDLLQEVGGALRLNRIEAYALSLRGFIQHILGLFYEAIDNYRKAVIIYNQENYTPGISSVLQRMGETYLALLRYEEALSCFERVLQIEPNNLQCCLGKASALELLGRDAEAIEFFRCALAIDPNNREARQGLAGLGVDV